MEADCRRRSPSCSTDETDPGERSNAIASQPDVARRLTSARRPLLDRFAERERRRPGGDAAERLRALGYSSGSAIRIRNPQSAMPRPDPKDRRELAARIAQVTSGELSGPALLAALEGIVRDDPRNGAGAAAARLRAAAGRRLRAAPSRRFTRRPRPGCPAPTSTSAWRPASASAAISPARSGRWPKRGASSRTIPPVIANLGLLQASKGDFAAAIQSL